MMSLPCERCDARCCRSYIVPLNGADLTRLAGHLGLPPEEWCSLEPVSKNIEEYLYFSVRLAGPDRFVVCLRRGDNGACLFHRRSSPQAACGIHVARPGMCRSYPITFCSGKAEHTDGCICPERWQLDSPDEQVFSELYIRYNADFADYKELTDLWERSYRQEYLLSGRLTGDHDADAAAYLGFLAARLHLGRPDGEPPDVHGRTVIR
ncbi:MAG TPA: YkgJ family cysteine cluster protein [Candidatus Ozemobacteraceae bacterium]